MGACRRSSRFPKVDAPVVATPATILSMTYDSGTLEVTVVFDSPVDGSLLDADWIEDTDNATVSSAFASQVDPVTVVFLGPNFPTFQNGHAWTISDQSAQGVAFPQTGIFL